MTAIILAAGFSRRFGGEKLLAALQGKAAIRHVADLVTGLGFKETCLVYRDEEVRKAAGAAGIKYILNERASEGMSTSVRAGIQNCDPDDAYIFFTGDQPFLDAGTVTILTEAYNKGKGSIIVPRYGGANGNPVIFSSEWKAQLESLEGDTGGRAIIRENPGNVFYLDIPNAEAGMDMDTWEDYARMKGDRAT